MPTDVVARHKINQQQNYITNIQNDIINISNNTPTNTEIDDKFILLKDGVSTDGDTLAKLRNLIGGIQTLLTVDDLNFDTLQEVVLALKSDESLLTSITSSKVNITDIIDDLIHINMDRPLSANQGKVLKDLLDTLSTTVNSLVADSHTHANKTAIDKVIDTGTGSKVLYDNGLYGEVVIGSGGNSANVYLTDDTSTTNASYKGLSYAPPISEVTKTITVNNNEVLSQTFLFDKEVGITALDAGAWLFNFSAYVSSTSGNTKLRVVTFKRDSSGVETDLFSTTSNNITSVISQTVEFQNIQGVFYVNSTDKIGYRVYGLTDRNQNITISYIVGDGRASYIVTPLAMRHSNLRDLNGDFNYQHITSDEKTKVNIISNTGDGTAYLSNDGTYKTVSGGSSSAGDITVLDTANNFTSIDKNVENILAELFIFANNGKISIANVIGSPSVNTETFTQLSSDVQTHKTTLANTLVSKGVTATGTEEMQLLVSKVNNISQTVNNYSGSNVVEITKLNITGSMESPYIKTVNLTNPINDKLILTGVREFVPSYESTQLITTFDNSDPSSFNPNPKILYDGSMHLAPNNTSESMTDTTSSNTNITSGTEWSYTVNANLFNSIDSITLTDGTVPIININGTNFPQVVTTTGDMDITGIQCLNGIDFNSTVSNGGICLIAVSVDGGITYKAYNQETDIWDIVDITNLNDFLTKGMGSSITDTLTSVEMEALRNESTTIRFAYCLSVVNGTSIASNQDISIVVQIAGYYITANKTDYDVVIGLNNQSIDFKFYKNGTFTMNYCNN